MTTATAEQQLTPAGQRILDAASDLFYRYGIHAVGVDTIAREANVTKKTIYDRFGSKDELINVYLQTQDRRWRQLISDRVDRPELDARAKILAMFEIMEFQIRERGCSFINAHAELSDTDSAAYETVRNEKAWTRDYFVELAREAGVPDHEKLGRQLLMLHEGAYIAYAMADESDAAQAARDAAEVLLANALG
jgi:AcrR family transcriptional regulator